MKDEQLREMISKEMEQFHCSILLDEVKEKVRKLKSYGVEDAEIDHVLHDDELFPELRITSDYRVVAGGREVVMEPLVKAVYLLFLAHPEGIVLKCLPDYREELTRIYLLLKPVGLTGRARKSIEDVTNATHNSINEKCTRIRNAFAAVLPASLAKYYSVSGKRGETKKILLPEESVVWECQMPEVNDHN